VSRVAHRDPSSPDGGAQNARDDAAFDGNKAAQALAVAQRAEQQAQEVARMVSKAQSSNKDRLDGLDTAISGLKSDVDTRISAIKNSAQAYSDSTQSELSKFRAEEGVLEKKVTQVVPLADAVQSQVS
jgi:type II secretory pathway pseudopilin PulG